MLKRVPDHIENAMFFRHETEDGKWEVAFYPVMFGVRVRAGRVGEMSLRADICVGDNQVMAAAIFSIVCTIIEERGYCPDEHEWSTFERKPVWMDPTYMGKLLDMLEDHEKIEKYEIPSIEEIRVRNLVIHGL